MLQFLAGCHINQTVLLFLIPELAPLYFVNKDLKNVVSPVDYAELGRMLDEADYDVTKTRNLVEGFCDGFSIGYEGKQNVKLNAPNLKLEVGSKVKLWNKVMKEVELGRYAGPFAEPPFEFYIQSPIGLVPKDGGRKTRLIFHLSYPRKTKSGLPLSVNANTPKEKTSVKYKDFEQAVILCIRAGENCKLGKSDMSSAFRHLGIKPEHWKFLVMKAESPFDGRTYYFVDKCLPFGAAISCAHFQGFSDAVAHLVWYQTGEVTINYLDDYLFVAVLKIICNNQIRIFLKICAAIRFPVALEKTFWATTRLTFLGFLIDSALQMVFLPAEKVQKAQDVIRSLLGRRSRKMTIKEVQQICGLLNFFCRCVIPGRAFTRRLYACTAGTKLMPHHHIRINGEMRMDLELWLEFLQHPTAYCRPFMDYSNGIQPVVVPIYTDASRNFDLGAGGVCSNRWWFALQWDRQFMEQNQPSIEYLELYAVTIAVLNWTSMEQFRNKRIALHCDNMSVVHMINSNTSSCKNCMVLIRIIVMHSLINNVRIYARHISGVANVRSDLLSRKKFHKFWEMSGDTFQTKPTKLPELIWPMHKVWLK